MAGPVHNEQLDKVRSIKFSEALAKQLENTQAELKSVKYENDMLRVKLTQVEAELRNAQGEAAEWRARYQHSQAELKESKDRATRFSQELGGG
jgi:hypothetical protein